MLHLSHAETFKPFGFTFLSAEIHGRTKSETWQAIKQNKEFQQVEAV
jgi:hypothetical protein